MLKRVIFLLLIVLAGCSNPTAPKDKTVVTSSPVKTKAVTHKPDANLWTINSFSPKEGQTEGKKYIRFAADGNFSDGVSTNKYMYAEVLFNKDNAGIFLRKLKRTNPQEKLSEPVQIKMVNSEGREINMTSTKRYNSSGGILIEKNNNDYSQFRIFMLQSTGKVTVEIRDSGSGVYNFNINVDGFSDSFSKL